MCANGHLSSSALLFPCESDGHSVPGGRGLYLLGLAEGPAPTGAFWMHRGMCEALESTSLEQGPFQDQLPLLEDHSIQMPSLVVWTLPQILTQTDPHTAI